MRPAIAGFINDAESAQQANNESKSQSHALRIMKQMLEGADNTCSECLCY